MNGIEKVYNDLKNLVLTLRDEPFEVWDETKKEYVTLALKIATIHDELAAWQQEIIETINKAEISVQKAIESHHKMKQTLNYEN